MNPQRPCITPTNCFRLVLSSLPWLLTPSHPCDVLPEVEPHARTWASSGCTCGRSTARRSIGSRLPQPVPRGNRLLPRDLRCPSFEKRGKSPQANRSSVVNRSTSLCLRYSPLVLGAIPSVHLVTHPGIMLTWHRPSNWERAPLHGV